MATAVAKAGPPPQAPGRTLISAEASAAGTATLPATAIPATPLPTEEPANIFVKTWPETYYVIWNNEPVVWHLNDIKQIDGQVHEVWSWHYLFEERPAAAATNSATN